ncbi:type II toxin-antitoxin system RelE/ParE family toxin [Yersinia ruckeri]
MKRWKSWGCGILLITLILATLVAAATLYRDIEQATQSLPLQPYMHRMGRLPSIWEIIVHPNYLVIYRVLDHIEILSILHARQEYP